MSETTPPRDDTREHPLDAITEEEITGQAPPVKNACIFLFQSLIAYARSATGNSHLTCKQVTELMSPRKRPDTTASVEKAKEKEKKGKTLSTWDQRALNITHGRYALGAYIDSPTSFPGSRVISYTKDFVVINDLYPKSSLHLLLLPRNPDRMLMHPFDALDGSDPEFLAAVKAETAKLKAQAADELRRRYGKFSAQDAARNQALDADLAAPAESANGDSAGMEVDLPAGRDWSRDIISGFHAGPSMNHLHVHVLSVDRFSEAMRHRKHYNSFATPFLVPVEDFPLAKDDPRRHPGREGYLDWDLKCWRCSKNFGNKFAALERHLKEEFEEWKRE